MITDILENNVMHLYLSVILIIVSIVIVKSNFKYKHRISSILDASSIFTYLLITILYFSADYFTNEGINEAVVYTMQYGVAGAGFGEYTVLMLISTLSLLLAFALAYLYYRTITKEPKQNPNTAKIVTHNILLTLAFLLHPLLSDLHSIYQQHNVKPSSDFEKYYKKPTITNKAQQSNKLNIVYIYAESLERTYFDEALFPKCVIL